jgi:S1-C subfamily serine protease
MKRKTILAVMLLCIAAAAQAAEQAVGPRLQEACVTIRKGDRDVGSGMVIIRQVEDEKVNFILTAEHVAKALRYVEDVISSDGAERKRVAYHDVQLLQERRHDGRTVGRIVMDAKVLNCDGVADLALLQVRAPDVYQQGVAFYEGDEIPAAGTKVYHVASPGGADIGAASLTSGVVSRIGVRIAEYGGAEGIFDQTDCAGLGGSSGGMICLRETGEVIGVVTLGLRGGDSFHWYVPLRRIRQWAKKTGVEWLLDPKGKTTKAELDKIPLENISPGFGKKKAGETETPVRYEIVPAVGGNGETEERGQ